MISFCLLPCRKSRKQAKTVYCFEVSEVTASACLMRSTFNRIFVYQCMEFSKHVITEEEDFHAKTNEQFIRLFLDQP